MNTTTYSSPVDKLLTIGEPDPAQSQDWPNYLELGLGPEHIPVLLRMLGDEELLDPKLLKEGEEKPEAWAPVHAMRALGQLRDITAVEPLLSQSDKVLDYHEGLGEWGVEELPEVFGLIGPAAIPALTAYIADKSHGVDSRVNASTGLEKIAEMHPEVREECVTTLTRQLESAKENDPELNAFIIDNLIHLKAVEAASVIEDALASGSVDMSIVGDWDNVQVELGLKPREESALTPTFKEWLQSVTQDSPPTPSSAQDNLVTPSPSPSMQPHKRASGQKNKRKMAKLARKKNRKKW